MSSTDTLPSSGTYTPGYAREKIAVIVIGLLVAAVGFAQLWRPLRLLLTGVSTTAEATRVIKVSPSRPEVTFATDLAIQAEVERRSHDAVFWNEFRFVTPDHREVTARANVGSQTKPLLPLLGDDGLPTMVRVCYDPAQPQEIIVPALMSTWLAPGMLTFCGLLSALIGAVLLHWANKPIELPHIAPNSPPAP